MPRRLNIFHLDFNYVALRPDYIRDWLQRLKAMGFNAILWELEDKVQWETCPECVWPEALSKRAFRKLLDESRALGLEPIPLLQTVGHAEYVLQHKPYRAFREVDTRHDCYCTSNPRVTKFLKAWITEYLDLFGDIRHFHLGGDEAYVFGTCPACAAEVAQDGATALFGRHIRALAKPLLKRGIRPGIWNDMIMKEPQALGLDPRTCVLWDWNYRDGDTPPGSVNLHALGTYSRQDIAASGILESFPGLVDERGDLRPFGSVQVLKQHGFEVVLCSAARSNADSFFCPRYHHAANVAGAARTVETEKLLGHCVTSWAIRLNDYATQVPFAGLAAYARRRTEQTSDALLAGYCQKRFGTDPAPFIEAMRLLGVSLPFLQQLTTGVQWNGLKDSLPPPEGYLTGYLAAMKTNRPAEYKALADAVGKALGDIPEGIRLLAGFFREAKRGFEIIEAWQTGAGFMLATLQVAQQRLHARRGSPELAAILGNRKHEYEAFLRRRELPLSAAKNAALVYDALIGWARG